MAENNESQKTETKLAIMANAHGLVLKSLDDMYRFGKFVVACRLATTPEEALIKIQTGAELNISPMRALQSVMVVKGQARIWGDTPLGLVRRSGLLEYIKEYIEGDIGTDLAKTPDNVKGVCITKRKGEEEKRTEFSVADAKRAGLWNKKTEQGFDSVWIKYPQRMLIYRPRAFNLRDNYPEVLCGVFIAEEYEGVEMNEMPLNDKPRSAILLETPEQPEVALEMPEITPGKPVETQTPVIPTETTPESIIKAKKVRHKKALPKEEVEKNLEEKLREYSFRCDNPKCGILFDEPAGQGEKPLCPKCLSSKVIEFKKNKTFA